jgi:membrane-bound serine protease (ClpP class)
MLFSMAATAQERVVVCPLNWMVDDTMTVVVKRAVAEARGAQALIFEIDTPGGRIDSAMDITNTILHAPCPTVAYVKGMGAISAGALISYSCKSIVMAPGTAIGASAPVGSGGGEMPRDVDEKTKSFLRARYRALGEENGHDPTLGEAMVDAGIEVRGHKDADGRYVFVKGKESVPAHPNTPEPARPSAPANPEDIVEEQATKLIHEVTGQRDQPVPEIAPHVEDTPPTFSADGSELVSASGKLLTLTTNEALKYGLISVRADRIDDVIGWLGHPQAARIYVQATPPERFFSWLTSPMIAGILLMIGIACIYIEIKTPGVVLPGVIGVICLLVFVASHALVGVAGWIDLALVVIGLGLVFAELFFIPSFGSVGIIGGVCLILGLYMSLTRVPIPQYAWDYQRLTEAAQTAMVTIVLLTAFIAATWKFLPRTPLYGRLVLEHAEQRDQGYVVQRSAETRDEVGLEGVARSKLRPAGCGRFNGVNYDVVTRGEFIEPGTPIRIIAVDGNRHVVEARKETTNA